MSLWVLGSARGSPGVTTTALAVAASVDEAVLVEADVDGGVLALRYGLGLEPGLTTLAASREGTGRLAVLAHAQRLPGGLPVLVGPDAPARTDLLWRNAGERLAAGLAGLQGVTVVADAGRLGSRSAARCLLAHAAVVVVVARPQIEKLVAASHLVAELRQSGRRVGMVLIGDRPYRPAEIAADLGCDVLGVVADDRRAARVLAGGGGAGSWPAARSRLARTVRALAARLQDEAPAVDARPARRPAPWPVQTPEMSQ